MKRLQISEILNRLSDFKSPDEKVEWLRQNDSPTLQLVLKHAFDPTVKYNLPEGDVPFKVNNNVIGMTESNLFSEHRRLSYLWLVPQDTRRDHVSNSKTAAEQLSDAQTRVDAAGSKIQEAQRLLAEAQAEYNTAVIGLNELKNILQNSKINVARLEHLFIEMLESLHADEAKVVVACKNKTLAKLYDVNKKLVKEAFPALL